MNLKQLFEKVSKLMEDPDNHECEVLIDTEARAFEAHLFDVKDVDIMMNKEDLTPSGEEQKIIIHIKNIGSQPPNTLDREVEFLGKFIATAAKHRTELDELLDSARKVYVPHSL